MHSDFLKGKFLVLFGFEASEVAEIPKAFRGPPSDSERSAVCIGSLHGQDRTGYASVVNNLQVSLPLNQKLLSHCCDSPLPAGREALLQSHSGPHRMNIAGHRARGMPREP